MEWQPFRCGVCGAGLGATDEGPARCDNCAAVVSAGPMSRRFIARSRFEDQSLGSFSLEDRGVAQGARWGWRDTDGALVVTAPPAEVGYPLLFHPGVFDGVEACVRFRVESGLGPDANVALWLRVDDQAGAYTVRLYGDGRLTVALRDADAVREMIAEMQAGDVLSAARSVELRAALRDDRLHVYVNGASAASVRCYELDQGYFILGLETGAEPLTVALFSLELRQPAGA
ncbi:MAG TPA: hypothetical protein VFS43_16315 [Polyangiaceae bacterium]|nr:hypothetical protein [Polyangiaceae bacterium]